MLLIYLILHILIWKSNLCECSKILCFFSVPSLSHQIVFRALTKELLKRGHELVIVTPLPEYPNQKILNLTEINVYEVSIEAWKKATAEWSANSKRDLYQQKKQFIKIMNTLVPAQISHDEVQNLLKDKTKHFDLIFIESGLKMFLVFSHIFKAPVIFISSLGANLDNYDTIGGPVHPLLYPPSMSQKFVNLTFWGKIIELYDYYWDKYIYTSNEKIQDEWLKKHFGEDTPTINDLGNNVHVLFLNVHRFWEGNRPVPPSLIYLGGLHQVSEKDLPKNLKAYLDASEHGVIYMSFGTNITPSLFAFEKLAIFINVFSKLPYDIILKWDHDEIPGLSKNVKVMKWVPQADLLRHPKIKLFIAQGGLQSTDESITAGVPLIGIPVLGDQWYMAEKYVQHKIGIKLEFDTLTEEQLKDAIETVIGDKSYRKNVVKLRTILYDQPQTSLERAVWWTEHVLRHGGAKHLRGPAANISWAEYYELNIVLTLLITLFIIISLLIYIVRFFFKLACKFVVSKLKND